MSDVEAVRTEALKIISDLSFLYPSFNDNCVSYPLDSESPEVALTCFVDLIPEFLTGIKTK